MLEMIKVEKDAEVEAARQAALYADPFGGRGTSLVPDAPLQLGHVETL